MSTTDELIEQHCEVAEFPTATGDRVRMLACKRCGALLWDVPKHMLFTHAVRWQP